MSDLSIESALPSIAPTEFHLLRNLVHRHTGIWLREGKEIMVASRLGRRLRFHHMSSFSDYYRYVERCGPQSAELNEFINCITTNKTAFFRERHHFAFLADTALPALLTPPSPLQTTAAKPSLRIWSAACSTGEEPYSIAIALLQAQLHSQTAFDMRIVASDIDTAVLAKAARGIYGNEELAEIESALHRTYFLRGKDDKSGCFKIKPRVRALVEFQRLNLMDASWPVPGPFDIVFFRNALIYFKRETQELFLRRIVRLLKPGGFLFLGHSEHIPWLHDILEPLQKTVYRVRSRKP